MPRRQKNKARFYLARNRKKGKKVRLNKMLKEIDEAGETLLEQKRIQAEADRHKQDAEDRATYHDIRLKSLQENPVCQTTRLTKPAVKP